MRDHGLLGKIKGYDDETGTRKIEQRNHFKSGDTVEIMPPVGRHFELTLDEMYDENMEKITTAPHPQETVYIPYDKAVAVNSIMRRK